MHSTVSNHCENLNVYNPWSDKAPTIYPEGSIHPSLIPNLSYGSLCNTLVAAGIHIGKQSVKKISKTQNGNRMK